MYEGRVLDPTDARPLDGEPQRLEGAGDARRWWVAAAGPSVPLPRALREVVRVRAGEASAEAEVGEGVPA